MLYNKKLTILMKFSEEETKDIKTALRSLPFRFPITSYAKQCIVALTTLATKHEVNNFLEHILALHKDIPIERTKHNDIH